MLTHLRHIEGLGGEGGQTMSEYAVVIGLITVSIVATIGLLSGQIVSELGGIARLIEGLGT